MQIHQTGQQTNDYQHRSSPRRPTNRRCRRHDRYAITHDSTSSKLQTTENTQINKTKYHSNHHWDQTKMNAALKMSFSFLNCHYPLTEEINQTNLNRNQLNKMDALISLNQFIFHQQIDTLKIFSSINRILTATTNVIISLKNHAL